MALKHVMFKVNRPGPLLGLLLFMVLAFLALFVAWESGRIVLAIAPPIMNPQNWLFLLGAVAAIIGWITSAAITVRNSIKQHTINTLLQSRLSAEYMKWACKLNKSFFVQPVVVGPFPASYFSQANLLQPANYDDHEVATYILNYLEFLAVGIRLGDLDERVMKNTIRGMVVATFEKLALHIDHLRGKNGSAVGKPLVLEHLVWLYERWKKEG